MAARWATRGLLVGITLTWGFSFTAIKLALTEVPPGALTFYRFLFGSLAFVVAVLVMRARALAYTRRDWLVILAMAATGMAAYHWALNWGEQHITPAAAALLVATNPLITYLISTTTGAERADRWRIGGVLLAFGGAALVIRFGDADAEFGVRSLVGALVTMIAPISWSVYTVIGKGVSRRHDPVLTMAIITWLGTLLVVPALLVDPVEVRAVSFQVWLAVAYLGVLSSGAAYLGWMYCLRTMEPTEVSASIYLVPIFAVTWDLMLLGTRPLPLFYVGALLVLVGLTLAHRAARRRMRMDAPPVAE